MGKPSREAPPPNDQPETYWAHAGEVGYKAAMYKSLDVAEHISRQIWLTALQAAASSGVTPQAQVADLGCGDGEFANEFLAPNFASVTGYDQAAPGIEAANAASRNGARFHVGDLTDPKFIKELDVEAAFLMGFLHHVKSATPQIISDLSKRVPKLIVMEPNGNHLMRKLLEQTPTYRRAGENSFRKTELERIYTENGYRVMFYRRLNLFPNFTPRAVFKNLLWMERRIEASRYLDFLCTAQIWGLSKAP